MTTALSSFGITEEQIIRKDGNIHLPAQTIARILQYANPKKIQQLIRENLEVLSEFVSVSDLDTEAGKRTGYIVSEEGIYIICMKSRQPLARRFQIEFARYAKAIRKREFVHISELQAAQKQLGEITEKWVCVKQKISKQRIERYHKFRALNLTQAEAARAARIPFRSAVRLEKAKQLLALSSAPLLERSAE